MLNFIVTQDKYIISKNNLIKPQKTMINVCRFYKNIKKLIQIRVKSTIKQEMFIKVNRIM